ncbi:MAG: hypothetical protein JRJ03_07975 [Deltaproteobacteria bacterium]|nr:hypothetical protein [Deltaproteobacteria bacterium]
MISFVSTFPPIICGIGTYTKYIVERLPLDKWRVISFDLNQFSVSDEQVGRDMRKRVDHFLSFSNLCLPSPSRDELLWFQHAFGMWGDTNDYFLDLVRVAKRRGNKVVATLHTVHFQSQETSWGMCKIEEDLLREMLPLVDALTLFTDGTYQAAAAAFPEYVDKMVVLRHGVHLYPPLDQFEARERFVSFLINKAQVPGYQKEQLKRLWEKGLSSRDVLLLGNYGFITTDKDPLALYRLGEMVQSKLPKHRVITIYAGIVQKTRDNTSSKRLAVLESLRMVHDGERNFFFELFIPEEIFPIALKALDFAVFWCSNATQSGRLAHAQGTGVIIAGRDREGVGETLRLSGLPAANSLEELAERITEMALEPGLRREVEEKSRSNAMTYSFSKQAQKHLLIRDALSMGKSLPALDRGRIVQPGARSWSLGDVYEPGIGRREEMPRMAA